MAGSYPPLRHRPVSLWFGFRGVQMASIRVEEVKTPVRVTHPPGCAQDEQLMLKASISKPLARLTPPALYAFHV